MTNDKSKSKETTGKAVRDVKGGATEDKPESGPQQIQIHAGNVPVVTVKLLDEINKTLTRIALALEKVLEKANG